MKGTPPICYSCIHLHMEKPWIELNRPLTSLWQAERVPVCDAFPQGIPEDIFWGGQPHLEPREGDHGIQFEPQPGT